MTGALQLDKAAVKAGANEWEIKVQLVELSGETKKAVDAKWESMVQEEHNRILSTLKESCPDVVPSSVKKLTREIAKRLKDETDTTVFYQEGTDNEEVRRWLLNEVLTLAGRVNTSFYLADEDRKKLDYLRYHMDNQSAEVVGEDTVMIRGVKKVVVVRISYVHS